MTLNRLLRGGNWNNNSNNCRASQRNNNTPDNINNNIGFRVVSTPRLELRQEIAAGKAKSPGTDPARVADIVLRHSRGRIAEIRIEFTSPRSGNPARGGALLFGDFRRAWTSRRPSPTPNLSHPCLRANIAHFWIIFARKQGDTQTMSAIKCCGKNQIRIFGGYKLICSVYVL